MPSLPLKNSPDPIMVGVMDDDIEFDEIYVLYYRRGTNPFPEIKHFHFKGTLKQAMDRGRQHCDNIVARFLRVEPFLHDLTEDEVTHRSKE